MENLRKIREKRHKNQLNVALEVGVTQESISMYESGVGYPSATVLIKLAKYLETSTDYLLGLTDDDTPIKYITKNLSAKEVELVMLTHWMLKLQTKTSSCIILSLFFLCP